MTTTFDIRQHIEFDSKNRAQCPSCLIEGKTGKNLSCLESGAYKCFRSCTPDQIRGAIGANRTQSIPVATSTSTPPPKVLVTPQKVKQATDKLLTSSTHALRWLNDRGITSEMITHYRLGITRAKVGDSSKPAGHTFLPAIAIPIPNHDGTAYFQKKRVRPWAKKQPDGYRPWSQYGIPAMVFTTHQPAKPQSTWLCEGEWDAIMLGWAVRNSELRNDIQVSCFTCGAGNVPADDQLAQLTGEVHTWYDHDAAGLEGAKKVQSRLKERGIINQVPALEDSPQGWDVSDAITAGLFERFEKNAVGGRRWEEPKSENPLRDLLVTNDELVARAPDFTDWLVDELLTANELFLVAASPRAGKSLLAMTLAHSVATGSKFLGRPVSQGGVLYVHSEDSETKVKERQMRQGWGEGLPIYWLERFKLNQLDHMRELIEELDIRLVVLDTLSRIRDASISESSAEMSQLLEPLQDMCRELRVCCILVHHTGKVTLDNAGTINVYDTIRGSSAIRATCRGTLILAADENCYRLHAENGWGKVDLQVLLDAHTVTWKLVGNWIGPQVDLPQKDRVLAYMTKVGKATIEQIAEGTGLPKRSLYEVLKRLQADEQIEKHGERASAVYIKSSIQQLNALENALLEKSDPNDSTPETQSQQGVQAFGITHVTEPIQQIQQLNSLLNSQDGERERDSAPIQQIKEGGGAAEKVILNSKSDQKNDHFSQRIKTPKGGVSVESGSKTHTQQGFRDSTAIQHDSTAKNHQSPEPPPDKGSSPVDSIQQNSQQTKSTDQWLHHVELDTPVQVLRRAKKTSLCRIPGMGDRRVANDLLVELDYREAETNA